MKSSKRKSQHVTLNPRLVGRKPSTKQSGRSRSSMRITLRRRRGAFAITSTAQPSLYGKFSGINDILLFFRNSESEYVAELQASLSSGTTWERICSLVELQNSQSKTIARTGAGTTDLSRFKEVLLRLKREGDAAPGAAGY